MAAAHAASTGATPRIVRIWKRICPSRRSCRLPTHRATEFYKQFNTLASPSGARLWHEGCRHFSDPLEPTVHWGPRGRDCDDGLPSKEDAMAARTQELTTLPARLETLLEVSRQLSRIQPLEALLGNMAEACGALLDPNSEGIRVVDGDDLVLMGVCGDARAAMPTPRIKLARASRASSQPRGSLSLCGIRPTIPGSRRPIERPTNAVGITHSLACHSNWVTRCWGR
jgi:hypothetical protein